MAALNESQVYEWLPYTHGETVPDGEAERYAFLKGMEITSSTTDAEILAASRGYAVRFAKTAAKFRNKLIERYGQEKGSRIRYAEAFELCDYGSPLTKELEEKLFPF